jgi:uncharacterized protein YraI
MLMLRFPALVCLALFAATAAKADGGPDHWAVRNLAPHEVLNMRAQPDVAAPIVGTIPYGARGLANLGCRGAPTLAEWDKMSERARRKAATQRWCRVRHLATEGWVRGTFLMEDH